METLFQIILRGYELFIINKEKKFLEVERINMLEKLIFTDRIRNLATLSETIPLNNSIVALKKIIKISPPNLLSDKQDTIESLKKLMNSAKQKNRLFLEIIRDIKKLILKQQDNFINYSLQNLIQEEKSKIETDIDIKIEIDKNLPQLKGEINIMRRLINLIFKRLQDVNRKPIMITANSVLTNNDVKGALLSFSCDFVKKKEKLWEMLPIFFSVYHHGGEINVKKTQVEIFLPESPDSIIEEETEDTEILNIFFDQFEVIKHYEAWLSVI
ncbi:MAG: hypothetical protein JRJ49_05315 [Deltaproteobacteria bacterium]|nr:hypothetical protein [Deltaproteobacteria bacterium]